MIITILIGGGTGLAAVGAWRALHPPSMIPTNISESVSFQLFYPTALPQGFSIDKTSFDSQHGIVVFSANGPHADHISFTVQRRPPTFDYDTFYKQGLSDATQFITSNGQAAIGKARQTVFGSLVAGESWVIVSPSSSSLSENDMKLIIMGLKKS